MKFIIKANFVSSQTLYTAILLEDLGIPDNTTWQLRKSLPAYLAAQLLLFLPFLYTHCDVQIFGNGVYIVILNTTI